MRLPCQRHLLDLPEGLTWLNCAYMSPQSHDVTEAGRYRVSARVPPGTLPDGSYSVRVGVLRFGDDGRELVHRSDKAFRVEVFGADPVVAEDLPRRGGKRNISLAWSVDRV